MLHVGLLVLLLIGAAAARPAYRKWHDYRTGQFRAAAEAAAESENWEVIEQVARRWTDWDPEAVEGWFYLADAAQALGDYESAQDALGKIPTTDPRFLPARAIRGDLLYLILKRPYDAEANWLELLEFDPRAEAARQGLISFYAHSRQRPKLLTQLTESIRTNSEPKEAYSYLLLADNLNFSDGYARVSEWIAATPDDEHLRVAAAYYAARTSKTILETETPGSLMFRGDRAKLESLVAEFPENLELLSFQLERGVSLGEIETVAGLLGSLPVEAERDNRFWRYKSWLHIQLEQWEEAVSASRTALDLHPFDWRSRLQLAEALRQMRQTNEAEEAARLAAEGKEIERELLVLPNATAFEGELAGRIARYATVLNEVQLARALESRGLLPRDP